MTPIVYAMSKLKSARSETKLGLSKNPTYEIHAIEKQTKNKKSRKTHKKQKNNKNNYKNAAGRKNPVLGLRRALHINQLQTPNLVPVLVVMVKVGKGDFAPVICLLDSGSSHSLLVIDALPQTNSIKVENRKQQNWSTKAGSFQTAGKATIRFMLPEFVTKPKFEYSVYIDTRKKKEAGGPFHMVLGREFLQEFGFNIRFSSWDIEHEGATVPMRDRNTLEVTQPLLIKQATFESFESEAAQEMEARMTRIVESKYEPADLDKVVSDCTNLTATQQQLLYKVLKQNEPMFDGQLGEWNMEPVTLTLKPDAKPYHARAYTIPKIYWETVTKEIQQLVERGVLRRVNRSEWAAPSFIVPKKLNPGQTVPSARFVSDFRKLNEQLVRHPYPVPKIQHLLQNLEGFKYGTSLDLVQGYYQMPLDDESRKLATIILPFGKFEYTRMPMGIKVAGDIFQQRMNELLGHLPFVRAYLDDVLIITKSTWEDHCGAIQTVLQLLHSKGLKVNAEKSFFGRTELEYLGFIINQQGIRPVPKKVQAITAVLPPTNRRQLRRFIGMINFNKDMIQGRSSTIAPLTKLTSKTVPWKWTEVEQKAFEEIKSKLSKQTLLTYPDFNKPFDIHTDASDTQLGAVISQENRPIAYFSRTLNSAQKNYTVTDKETLSIVETLKEYRNILYGHIIRVYTDHKNLTHPNTESASQRVMRWRLLMEEFGVELIYIKGEHNVAADALSRLPRREVDDSELDNSIMEFLENYEVCTEDFPLNYPTIAAAQERDKALQRLVDIPDKQGNLFIQIPFVGGGSTVHLVTNSNKKIIIPDELRERIIEWYHDRLVHPGRDRLFESINQHFECARVGQLRNAVSRYVAECDTCQKAKKAGRSYGQLPVKQVVTKPWEILHVDLYGPKKIKRADGSMLEFKVMTMVDPVTGWFEMMSYDDATPETIMNLLEIAWLCRYPRPAAIIADRGGEFTGQFFRESLRSEYGIELRLITTANPQSNAVVERIHQVIGNMLRSLDVENCYLMPPPYDPFIGIISAIGFAIRTTWSTTNRATPGQLVFGRDMLLNIRHLVDWHYMQTRRQRIATENNARENARRIPHHYNVGDLVLKAKGNPSDKGGIRPTMQRPYEGPYEIHRVWNNGTVTIRRTVRGGAIFERINIRRIRPYRQQQRD